VTYHGQPGVIKGATHYLSIILDGNRTTVNVHPTDPDLVVYPTTTPACPTATMKESSMPQLIHEDLAWVLRHLPKSWLDLMKTRPNQLFIAGGCIRSVIAREPINDVDFFAPNADIAAACALALSESGKIKIHRTENAHTVATRPFPAQFIHRWTFKVPEDAIKSFDFTIAKAAIWWDGQRWASVCDERFYADMASKRLVYCAPKRDEEAGGSILRVLKFYQRGYRIPLDSMGDVLARLVAKVRMDDVAADAKKMNIDFEEALGRVLTALLVQVDPSIDPTHEAHLPTIPGPHDAGTAEDGDAVLEITE
jgi:hypothetical protein